MLLGIILLIIGLFGILHVLIPTFDFSFSLLWPVILVVSGAFHLLKNKGHQLWGIILIIVGFWFFFDNIDIIPDRFDGLIWPVLFIIAGLSVIYNLLTKNFKIPDIDNRHMHKGESTDSYVNVYGVFSGSEEKIISKDFIEANVYAVFGGSEVDFTDITIKNKSAVINVYSVFGGSEIVLPKKYNVVFNSMAFLGGNDNKFVSGAKESAPTIYVNLYSVFGGSEIK